MRTIRVVSFVMAFALSFISVRGATYVVPPDEWMVDDAGAIVSGTVLDVYPRYTGDGQIETVSILAVDEVLKGAIASDRIEVVEWGGHIGNEWMTMSGAPRYVPGRRYLVFLTPNRNGEWSTQHLTLGQFAFVPSPAGDLLVRDADEIRGWDISGDVAVEHDRCAREFAAFIRSRVSGTAEDASYFSDGRTRALAQRKVVPTFADYDFVDACTVGVNAWTDDPNSSIRYSISGTPASGNTKAPGDAEDRIIEEDPNGDISGAFTGSGVVATAYSSGSTGTIDGKAYILISGSDIVTQNGVKASGLGQSKFRTALAHELGHTLGFRHSNRSADDQSACASPLPCATGTIMNSSLSALDGVLTGWDSDAARASYGIGGGESSDYGLKFCANGTCTTFTAETGRRTSAKAGVAWRLAGQACTPASISTQPQSKSIASGATTSLSVTAAGTSPFTYQWYLGTAGDTSSPVGTNAATLSNLSPTSTTSYWVRVTGQCGPSVDSNTATITVQACTPPSITTQPLPKSAPLGSSVKMQVAAAGTGPLTYQWYVGNSGDTSSPIAGATSASPNITLNATANVWVRVTGACAPPADSNSVTITITACPDVIVGTPTATGFAANWTLSVAATSLATGPLTYEWYRGSNPGSTVAPKVGEGQTLQVVVDAVTQFWAKVTNSCGTSRASELVVVAPCQLPVIATQPADRTIPKNGSTQLTVGVTGEGITIQWYLGTAPDKTTPVAAGASITVGPLQATTSYWASLTNTCGEIATRTVVVTTVEETCTAPSIQTQPSAKQEVKAGQSSTLTVVASGTPTLHYQWYEGVVGAINKPVGIDAPSFTTPTLFATTRYWVKVTNGCGEASSTNAEVTVPKGRRRATRS